MMLSIATYLLLAFGPEDPGLPVSLQDELHPAAVEGMLGVRAGVWGGRNFKFDAIRTDSKQVTSEQEALFSASMMVGLQFQGHVVLFALVEGSLGSQIVSDTAGLFIGWRERPSPAYGNYVPEEVMVYAGGLTGHIDVGEDDFGDFDRAWGFGGGIRFGWELSPSWTANLFAEYRYLKFDYQPAVITGDTSIGGHGGWFGIGLNLRF